MKFFYVLIPAVIISVLFTLPLLSQQEPKLSENSIALESFKRGVYHYELRQFDAAIAQFSEALEKDHDFFLAREWLGKSYYKRGIMQYAIQEWSRILDFGGGDDILRAKINGILTLRQIFDRYAVEAEYNLLKAFSLEDKLSGSRLSSIKVKDDDSLFIVDYSGNKVSLLNKNGQLIHTISRGNVPFERPYDIGITKEKTIYISDFGNDTIHKYAPDMSYMSTIGTKGVNEGQFYGPKGLDVDGDNNLYVVDFGNQRVQKFDSTGGFLLLFGTKDISEEEGVLNQPTDVLVTKDGQRIFVSDTGNQRIAEYDSNGQYVKSYGTIGSIQLKKPLGIQFLDNNERYMVICDEELGILKLNIELSTLVFLKSKIKEKDMTKPMGIDADNNKQLYLADFNQSVIALYAPGHTINTNLFVDLYNSFSFNYPAIDHFIRVSDKMGNFIKGLTSDNFKIYVANGNKEVNIPNINCAMAKFKNDRMSIAILNEKSPEMMQHKRRLEEISRKFLKELSPNDQVEVINFNSDYWVANEFINSELKPLDSILENKYDVGAQVGLPFVKAIQDQLNMDNLLFKKRIILFTSGQLTAEHFEEKGYEEILNFAKNNFIPIYVVSFGDHKNENILDRLASETDGHLFVAYKDTEVERLVKTLRDKEDLYYILSYTAEEARGEWSDVTVQVNYRNLFGQDRSGYYVYR